MKNRQILLFSILIAVAMLGMIFIFFYRPWTEISLQKYMAKITTCGNILDENDCYAKSFCEGIYGPVNPDSNQFEFKRCQKIPFAALLQLEKEKNICQTTQGQWYRNKLGNFCLCDKAGAGQTFDKTKGCISK